MSSGDRDDIDDRADGLESQQAVIDRARRKVSTPGLFLTLAGLLGLLLEVVVVGMMVTKPTIFYDVMVDMIQKGPPGPEQQKQLADLKQQEAAMRLDGPMNIASAGVGIILNLLSVVGGLKMRSLSGYGLALTGTITGIIPLGGCCCATFPVGIWALIVLMNQDVKAGFAANARRGPSDRNQDRDSERYD